MGGYAGYLAAAYGVTGAVMVANILLARRQFRATWHRLSEQLRCRQGPPDRDAA